MKRHNPKASGRPKPRRWSPVPLITGAVIAALGLTLGGVTTASALNSPNHHHPGPPTSPPTTAPRNGESIPNVTIVEDEIKDYYGSVTVTAPAPIGTETLPSPSSNYAKQMHGIEARAEQTLRHPEHARSGHHHGKPALVFDIDDTLLNTYNYEIAQQFGYTPASNAVFVNAEAFPAVFGMPQLINWAQRDGYHIFFITGRPVSQFDATVGNLQKVGYHAPMSQANVFLKDTANPPAYLNCGSTCTTIQYKSQTRAHIEKLGYDIVGNFGDQYSDLKGGYSQHTFKLPNPMYYLP